MKYAVIRTGGKQYKVQEGDTIEIEHVSGILNEAILFDEVLLVNDTDGYKIGAPTLADLQVKGVIMEHFRGKKIRVGKFKSKVRHRRVMGHRQSLSKVKIETIGGNKISASARTTKTKTEKTEVTTTKAPKKA